MVCSGVLSCLLIKKSLLSLLRRCVLVARAQFAARKRLSTKPQQQVMFCLAQFWWKVVVTVSTRADDKRLQNTLKRLGVNNIPGIEEVMFNSSSFSPFSCSVHLTFLNIRLISSATTVPWFISRIRRFLLVPAYKLQPWMLRTAFRCKHLSVPTPTSLAELRRTRSCRSCFQVEFEYFSSEFLHFSYYFARHHQPAWTGQPGQPQEDR
jgi:hypothetical protein